MQNSTVDPPSDGKLGLAQQKAGNYPLPDGTISPSGPSTNTGITEKDNRASLSEVENSGGVVGKSLSSKRIDVDDSGRSSIPRSDHAFADHKRKIQRQAENQIPDEVADPPATTSIDPATAVKGESGASGLTIEQEKDLFYTPASSSSKVLSALPRTKVPKKSETTQKGDPHVPDEQLNQDVFYSSADREETVSSEEEQLTEEQYSELFHSPKIKDLLRRNLKSTERNLPDPKSPWSGQKRSFSTSAQSSTKTESEREMQNLAADIANDARTSAKTSSEVCSPFSFRELPLIS